MFVYVYIKSDASNTKSYILTRHRSQKNNLNIHILCCLSETNYILFTSVCKFIFSFLEATTNTGVCVLGAGSGMGAAAVFERGDSADELRNAKTVKSGNLLSRDAQ